MKKLVPYILLILCAIFTSCERIENGEDFAAKEIKLFARMGVHITSHQTKGEGVMNSSSNTPLNIGLLRLDKPEDNAETAYPYFKNCQATPLTAVLQAPEENLRLVDFSTAQFYKNSQAEVAYTAWYPWPATSTAGYTYTTDSDSTTISFPIPSTGDSDIMYTNTVKGKMSTGFEVMQFNHALSLFRIHVYSSTTKNWGTIESVSLQGLPDSCSITLPSGENKSGYRIRYANSKANKNTGITMLYTLDIDKKIPDGFENKKFIKEWIGAPAELSVNNPQIKVLNILVTTANGDENTNGTHTINIARNFSPGHMYDIVLRFSDDGVVNAEVQVQDWQKPEEVGDIYSDTEVSNVFYNLSENGNANCYIVSSANFSYCFDATIKGNGSTAAMPGARLDPTLSPKSVGIIWSEVEEPYFKLETTKIVEGKVLFTVKGNDNKNDKSLVREGNVLLGVYDENGHCIWTWHIWITDKPQKQNYKNGYVVLDRNLGATSKEGKGLFYQWGRPTPFRHISDTTISATKEYKRVIPDVAVANPGIFYGRFESNTSENKENDFNSGTNPNNYHDWVDRTIFRYVNNLWGYREEEHEQPIKTLYDPCPAGYHVPYSRNWENMENSWKTFDINNWENKTSVSFVIENGEEIIYPFQGYINRHGGYKSGHIHINGATGEHSNIPIVEAWSALINRHDEIDAGLADEKINDSPYRFMFTKDTDALTGKHSRLSDSYSNRSRGLAVRCVGDNTTDVVKDLSASQTANCYMVHEAGYYKFKATVRGNGVGSLLPLGGTTTAEINGGLSTTISPARVDILWWQGDFTKTSADFQDGEIQDFPSNVIPEENAGTIPPKNMCISLLDNGVICEDGYVSFQVSNFSKGNAVLAAYNDYDEILWTWHIWLTDKPEEKISGNYTKMDRFLGATHAPTLTGNPAQIAWKTGEKQATLGFYYQWGKKDPIIGPPAFNSGSDDPANNALTVESAGWWKKVGNKWTYRKDIDVRGQTSVRDVVKEPTAFYKSTTTDSQQSSQWFPANFADAYTNVAMWGYAVADYSLQGQTFSKTMHDPCPPGYRTPFHFSWRYDGTYKYAEGDAGETTTRLSNSETGWDSHGIVTNKEHFEKMWFPFAGYRDPLTGGYINVGTYGYMNTGMPMGQYNTRSFWYNNSYTGQYAGRHGSAYGKMIRCMKE